MFCVFKYLQFYTVHKYSNCCCFYTGLIIQIKIQYLGYIDTKWNGKNLLIKVIYKYYSQNILPSIKVSLHLNFAKIYSHLNNSIILNW